MVRDPAIHVTRSELLKICKEEGVTFPEDFVDALILKASKVKLTSRVMILTKANTAPKAARTTTTDDNSVAAFNAIYMATLVNHNKRSQPIHKGTKQYLVLKEVATAAAAFAKDFGFKTMPEAFKTYVGLGIILIGINKFSIYRLKGADSKIRIRHENMEVLDEGDSIALGIMRKSWERSLNNFHNLSMDINIDQMADIARAVLDAHIAGAVYNDWMDAQFDKWTFLNTMPEFSQLHGDNATLAYTKYMASKKQEYTNDAERQHFETVKNEKEIPIKGQKRQRG